MAESGAGGPKHLWDLFQIGKCSSFLTFFLRVIAEERFIFWRKKCVSALRGGLLQKWNLPRKWEETSRMGRQCFRCWWWCAAAKLSSLLILRINFINQNLICFFDFQGAIQDFHSSLFKYCSTFWTTFGFFSSRDDQKLSPSFQGETTWSALQWWSWPNTPEIGSWSLSEFFIWDCEQEANDFTPSLRLFFNEFHHQMQLLFFCCHFQF